MPAVQSDVLWTCSGDSHFTEPPDLYDRNLPKEQADRLPRSVTNTDGEEVVTVDGQTFRRKRPRASSPEMAEAHKKMADIISQGGLGATDPTFRLRHLDEQGVWGEVNFPSIGFWLGEITDPQLSTAAATVLNDFIHDQMIRVSPRFIPTATIPLQDLDLALRELTRVTGLGFKAAFFPTSMHDGMPKWNSDHWEPVWAACEEAGTVVAFHIGTEPGGQRIYKNPGGAMLNYVHTTFGGQQAAAMMVAGGAFERHPDLKVLISEGGATWAPFLGDRLNEGYRQHFMFDEGRLRKPPKDYLMQNVYASFQHDETAVPAMQAMGYRNVLFGTDYPHAEGTFPHTQKVLREVLAEATPETSYRIRKGAFLELFPSVGTPPGDGPPSP
jgi:predicted TIM-barrel fold metal-dependent hydrolase